MQNVSVKKLDDQFSCREACYGALHFIPWKKVGIGCAVIGALAVVIIALLSPHLAVLNKPGSVLLKVGYIGGASLVIGGALTAIIAKVCESQKRRMDYNDMVSQPD